MQTRRRTSEKSVAIGCGILLLLPLIFFATVGAPILGILIPYIRSCTRTREAIRTDIETTHALIRLGMTRDELRQAIIVRDRDDDMPVEWYVRPWPDYDDVQNPPPADYYDFQDPADPWKVLEPHEISGGTCARASYDEAQYGIAIAWKDDRVIGVRYLKGSTKGAYVRILSANFAPEDDI